jgi:hypothetical protein
MRSVLLWLHPRVPHYRTPEFKSAKSLKPSNLFSLSPALIFYWQRSSILQ